MTPWSPGGLSISTAQHGTLEGLGSKGQGSVMGRWKLRRDRQCSQDIFSKAPLQTGSDKKGVVAVSKRVGEWHTPFRHQMEAVSCRTTC